VPRAARRRLLRVRGLDINLTQWGPEPDAARPALFILHGFADCGLTFQFLVDAFAQERAVIAPDWRGFGRSEWSGDGYWFPDYLADLDALLESLSPHQPARLLGHSMGGNVASLYAGIRPERVHSMINIEGLGLKTTAPEQAPARYRKWLSQVRSGAVPRRFDSYEKLVKAIRLRHPRVTEERAIFIAEAWAQQEANGSVTLLGDPRHKWVNPVLYRREEAEHCWRKIEAPYLMIVGELSEFVDRLGGDSSSRDMQALAPRMQLATIAGAGHMMHMEQPEPVAAIVESFLDAH
jgi:pimeloyl-ACP methyl ester carboxylesterase